MNLRLTLLAAAAFAATLPAAAQNFPQRPVRFVVPYAPGGSTDTLARSMGTRMSELLGQQGIVVARRTIAKYRESLQILPVNLRKTL